MDLFLILQMLFDAVLLFGILFLFHYSVHQTQKKKEESDILKNIQVQEIKENLQELLMTLKQLGKEVSDNIQEQVREAEEKTELFKKVVIKLQRDLQRVTKLAGQVDVEKGHLEEKMGAIQAAKKHTPKIPIDLPAALVETNENMNRGNASLSKRFNFNKTASGIDFSSGVVKEVYRLLDEKVDLNEIVQLTKLSRAEIQLILNLRGNGFTTPN